MKTKDYIICALFAAVICVCSVFVAPLPFTPVPVTLQVMAISVTGGILGHKKASITIGLYLFMGIIGLPVFSGMKSGIGVLFGPTGGYLLGFLPQVITIGFLSNKYIKSESSAITKYIQYFIFMIFGLILLYTFGAIQFMIMGRVSFFGALGATVLPFIIPDILKVALAVFISCSIRQNLYHIHFEKA